MSNKKQVQETRMNTHKLTTNLVAGDLSRRGYRFKLNDTKRGFADLIVETQMGEIEINVKGSKTGKNWVLIKPLEHSKDNQYYAFGSPSEPKKISYINQEHMKELLDRDKKRTDKRKEEEGFEYSKKWSTLGFPYEWTYGYDDLPK